MKKRLLLGSTAFVVLAGSGALAFFEPWRAFTSSTLDEALPVSASVLAAPTTSSAVTPSPSGTPSTSPESPRAQKDATRSERPERRERRGSAEATPQPARTPKPEPTPQPAPVAAKPVDRVLTQGEFVDAEYDTDGVAKIIELADGRRFLRIENLSTSDGPDVHVWLSEATAGGSWGKYDDNGYVKLGKLKATNGNLNYEIPAGVDISTMRSAVIWCDRFNVAFGAAPLDLR